jgi:hypothetical protein
MIYDHFNKTLWEKITAEGPAFYDEVQHFSNIQQRYRGCNMTIGKQFSK